LIRNNNNNNNQRTICSDQKFRPNPVGTHHTALSPPEGLVEVQQRQEEVQEQQVWI